MPRLRSLIIAENLPYPTFKGGDLRNWQNVNALLELGEVGVFGLCANDTRRKHLPRPGIAYWCSSKDPALVFPPLPGERKLAARAWLLSEAGHPADLYYSKAAAAEMEDLLAQFNPHIVVFERLWLYRYIAHAKRSHCRIVLDNHNVEAVLYRQLGASTRGDDLPAKLMREALPARTAAIEREVLDAVDQVWVCSTADERLMRSLYSPRVPITVVPNGVDLEHYHMARTRTDELPKGVYSKGKAIIFPGMFGYAPNARGADFLIQEVFPRLVPDLPDLQLLLVGGMPTPTMLEAAKKEPRVLVTGVVADTRPYIAAASAMVVPLFEASGTRYKILEAFAAKLPVISTRQGAEGLEVQDGKHLLIAEGAAEFAAAVKQLAVDEQLANRLRENAFELIKNNYSWKVIRGHIQKAVHELETANLSTKE